MLPKIITHTKKFRDYKEIILPHLYNEIRRRSRKFKNLRVAHLNATVQGGGVAEILSKLVPLLKDIGLKAKWYVIPPDQSFFEITKKIHNALQGSPKNLTEEEKKYYLRYNRQLARLMQQIKPRPAIWVIHDPQPAAAISFFKSKIKAIWRCHIDTSTPNQKVWRFIKPQLTNYQKLIFSLPDFVPPDIDQSKVKIFAPAIDPLSPKNKPLPLKVAKTILSGYGINPNQPLVSQVSRFDPWKDPLGVIDAYYLAKNKIPKLQLALIGLFLAKDDPEAIRIYQIVKRHAHGDPDIFLFSDPTKINLPIDTFVNAFQTASDVIIQKSIREGFGLAVTEALWKEKPVVGGAAGGIKFQIKDGINGFLVNSSREAADRIIQLIKNQNLAKKMGRKAKSSVRKQFLIPRLINDYLKLFEEVM